MTNILIAIVASAIVIAPVMSLYAKIVELNLAQWLLQ